MTVLCAQSAVEALRLTERELPEAPAMQLAALESGGKDAGSLKSSHMSSSALLEMRQSFVLTHAAMPRSATELSCQKRSGEAEAADMMPQLINFHRNLHRKYQQHYAAVLVWIGPHCSAAKCCRI